MEAEDLHIAPVMTWWNKENLWAGRPLPKEHLVSFDGFRHARTQHAVCEPRVANRYYPGRKSGYGKDSQGNQRLWQCLAESAWIGPAVKAHDAADFRFVTVVNEVMAAPEKLI